MELIYSMRRKPLKCEPPHFDSATDPEIIRPICTISICNIIAFSSLTELSDTDGDTWGGHVYVCDLDTPWDSHRVASTVHPVSALEWDCEGKQILVATTVGDVSVYGQKDYLLNEWTCLYTANFPGEHIIQATFFHNGRRVVSTDKKLDAPINERMQLLRSTPTLKGFGGVWCAGACVVTATGLVGALTPGEAGRALVATDCLRAARDHFASASIAHKNGSMLIAASFIRGGIRGVRVSRCSVSRPSSSKCAPVCIQLQPLPSVYLDDDVTPVTIAWWLRDDTDALLIASTNLTLWKLVERAYPVHKLLSKGPLQGSTTPGGGPKTVDCFNTLSWQQAAAWQLEGGGRALGVSASRAPPPAPALAALVSARALHLLARDTMHYLVSRPVVTGSGAAEVAPGAATPPKKTKYGGGVPSGAPCATVHSVSTSWLGALAVVLDSHSQLHLYRLQPLVDMPSSPGVSAAVCQLEHALLAGSDGRDVLLTLGPHAAEAVYERITENFQRQPPAFQQYYFHTWLKLRITICGLSPSLKTSAASLQALQNALSAWAACGAALQNALSAWAPCGAALRDERGDGAALQNAQSAWAPCGVALRDERGDGAALQNAQSAWAPCGVALRDERGDGAALQNAQSAWAPCGAALRDERGDGAALQNAQSAWAPCGAALRDERGDGAALQNAQSAWAPCGVALRDERGDGAALQNAQSAWAPCGVALRDERGDGAALQNAQSAWAPCGVALRDERGDGAALQNAQSAWAPCGVALRDERGDGAALQNAQSAWAACGAALRDERGDGAKLAALLLEYGVEPEMLPFTPEPPAHAQSDTSPSLDMDSIKYMYRGGRGRAARRRRYGRRGVLALPVPRAATHALQRAHDGRYVAACRPFHRPSTC